MDEKAPEPSAPTLRVQTVLYCTAREQVRRFAQSFTAAAGHALRRGAVSAVELAVGDCSPQRVLGGGGDLGSDVADTFASVTYRFFGRNLGSAGGHNELFAEATTDFVLVVNPDTYASPMLLTELVSALTDPTVGIAEARQLPLEHPKARDAKSGDVSWASGACFLVRTSVVEGTGGFDTGLFFLHGDDVDFSWRTRLLGWRVVQRPAARIFHDKRLDPQAVIRAGAGEAEHSARASVLLPWRYSRREVALERLAALESSDDGALRAIGRELRARVDAGRMPEPIDADHRVAQFAGADYATHRFSYAEP